MFPMNPAMSWLTIVALAVVVALLMVAGYRRSQRRAEQAAAPTQSAVAEPLAIVTELRPRPVPDGRHLALVPELRALERSRHLALVRQSKPAPSPELFDWQIHGI